MKEILISRNKVKNFLSERLTKKVINMTEESVFSLIRYEGLGGYGKISDNDLFVQMVEVIPEFKLLQMVSTDENHIVVTLKEEYTSTEDAILIDIVRIIQTQLN
jgi:hypothetical protein